MKNKQKQDKWFSVGWFIFWLLFTGPGGFVYLAVAYLKNK